MGKAEEMRSQIREALALAGSLSELLCSMKQDQLTAEMCFTLGYIADGVYEAAGTALALSANVTEADPVVRPEDMITTSDSVKPVDDDPDWLVKAEGCHEEKKLQEDPFPVPVGSERAKDIIAKVAADNPPRKKGRPKKGA